MGNKHHLLLASLEPGILVRVGGVSGKVTPCGELSPPHVRTGDHFTNRANIALQPVCIPTVPLPYSVPWTPHILQSKFCSQMGSSRDGSVPWNRWRSHTALPPFFTWICVFCLKHQRKLKKKKRSDKSFHQLMTKGFRLTAVFKGVLIVFKGVAAVYH